MSRVLSLTYSSRYEIIQARVYIYIYTCYASVYKSYMAIFSRFGTNDL